VSLDIQGVLDAIVSHALTLGVFESVNGHEPRSAPGNGLTGAVWVDAIQPVPSGSGLNVTTCKLTVNFRIYTSFVSEPQDLIDPQMIQATDLLFTAYSGDFEFGGLIKNVDLLGEYGAPLSARAGYLNQDGTIYRIMEIVLPLVINNVWAQSP